MELLAYFGIPATIRKEFQNKKQNKEVKHTAKGKCDLVWLIYGVCFTSPEARKCILQFRMVND